MFELLTRVLLWVLIVTIIWYIFSRFINKVYLTWLGGLIVFAFIILAFLEPTNKTVGTVWSILSLPLKPLGLAIFLLLNSLKEGTKKIAANQVVAALLVLFFTSTPIVSYWLASQTERSASTTVQLQGDSPPNPSTVRAIVILGDGTSPADPTYGVRTQFSSPEDGFGTGLVSRLYYAGQIYQNLAAQGNTPLVIVSAGPQPDSGAEGANRTEDTINLLVSAGVPEERILIEPEGVDVRSSALEVEQLLVERGYEKANDTIVLISPAINIRRATSAFAQVGLQAQARPTDFFAFQLREGRRLALLSDLVPNVEALALTTRVVDEYLTSVYYFLRGWLLNPVSF
ncbi:YdcF family protein [Oscillatoria sp. FACHB-1407]|uniref:YdcF family protein n=1 Tax=Oscillatoria sp. FACHB-1407 TaxID=2692847 RepID=UPI001684ECFD|nr:YdcF family protein [Oscillatoria sp. FACHB-1407]MBD2464498.1 YdcF family protein [Oscillatoria sp. FACHB-1407]